MAVPRSPHSPLNFRAALSGIRVQCGSFISGDCRHTDRGRVGDHSYIVVVTRDPKHSRGLHSGLQIFRDADQDASRGTPNIRIVYTRDSKYFETRTEVELRQTRLQILETLLTGTPNILRRGPKSSPGPGTPNIRDACTPDSKYFETRTEVEFRQTRLQIFETVSTGTPNILRRGLLVVTRTRDSKYSETRTPFGSRHPGPQIFETPEPKTPNISRRGPDLDS